ncbi:hypothetical protein QR90_08510 [Deinococcus radiopugnans]|uniref:Sacsin/Nov domain-containing protein n=1 Tax=Deinococcus radiopugnans TaxID=57497 RepID=A0A0A7KIR8_9DEIO|nr:hypothetical protein [Deinococcus radiopugnans]AIZ45134.1 hypothetical protein QR90_08510 [Deinococcus radiopugnans]
MAGFITNSVELIQRILFDGRKTDELLVLKELIQNADDARAGRLQVGLSDGLPDAEHPLLRGPALYVVNDGPFDERHARAVRSLGGSSKVEEDAAIGKFGIGLKSVFFLGEVFFFLCRSLDDDGRDISPLAQVLNPWNNGPDADNPRPEWDRFSPTDRKRMRAQLGADDATDGFTVWVPLRTRSSTDLEGGELSVYQSYPGDDEELQRTLFSQRVYREIARMLPLMRHLRAVHFHAPSGLVVLDAGESTRSQYPDLTGEREFAGRVRGQGAPDLQFTAAERVLATPRIQQLREDGYWPRRQVAGTSRQVEDKARAHTAVVFKRQAASAGSVRPTQRSSQLVIQWAVFLPLGESESVSVQGQADFHLTLHGCFFITADRRDILAWHDAPRAGVETGSQLQQQWNAELARQGTLPLLLPTLAEFAYTLPPEEILHLTVGLHRSRLFSAYRADLCRRGQWILTLEQGWRLVGTGTRLLAFPRLQDAPDGDWLPGQREVGRRAILIEENAPHLMVESPSTWTADELRTLFHGLRLAELDERGLDNLAQILSSVAHHENLPARRLLLADLLTLDQKTLDTSRKLLAALVDSVPLHRRFALPKGVARHVRERLALLPTDVLVLPGELEVEGQAQLSVRDALTLLQALAGQRGTVSTVARVLNAVVDEDRHTLRAAVSELPLVEVRSLKAREPEFIAPADAFQRVVQGRLHRATDTTRAWAEVVERAFGNLRLAMTDGVVLEALDSKIESFGPEALMGLIRQGSVFAALAGRQVLLQHLLDESKVETLVPLLRVTLHGDSRQIDEQGPLYQIEKGNPALERLASQLLAGRQDAWRVVPKALVDLLNEPQKAAASVRPMDAAALADLVLRHGTAHVDASSFSEEERLALLKELPPSVACKLPFHPARGGQLVALDADTLMPGDGTLPPVLAERVTLLSADRRWQELWQTLGVQTLDAAQAVTRVLNSADPSTHALWLLDRLAGMAEDTLEALREQIAQAEWLPDAAGEWRVTPGQVLVLPQLAGAMTRVLAAADHPYLDPAHLPQELAAHPGFRKLVEHGFMLTGEDAALALAGVMAAVPQDLYCCGDLEMPFEEWWGLLGELESAVLPALDVLRPLHAVNPAWSRQVWERLDGALPDQALGPLLNHLAQQLKLKPEARDRLEKMHVHFLTQVRDRGLWPTLRERLLLRNRQGQWRLAGELCVQAEGVGARELLHHEHQTLLGDFITPKPLSMSLGAAQAGAEDVGAALQMTAAGLEAYFAPWEGLVPGELIGAFLSLLGGDLQVEALARRHLHSRSLDTLREIVETDAGQRPRNVGSFEEWVDLYRVTVRVSDENQVWVMSLTDQPLRVTKDTTRPNVVVGRPEPGRIHGEVFVTALVLDALDPGDYTQKELADALLAATRAVLRGMYLVRQDRLDDLWKQLSESDQFDLLYTQDVIIQDSISYVRYQLSLSGKQPLNDLFTRWDAARHREAEEQHNALVSRRGRATAEIEKLRGELRAAFENEDPEVVPRLLEAVRRRVQDAQYIPASVPFELLQNADDALEELKVMRAGGQVSDTFVVQTGPQNLTFMHWGRAINQFALTGFDGEELGFKADLKKMLMLSASDKGSSALQVTGKFGMGFKSVYLLADRPRVVSGRLAFDVLGGVYPKQLAPEAAAVMRGALDRHGDRMTGTAIALDVDREHAESALADFRSWLPVLLVFTRQVKRVVDATELAERVVSWQELPLGEGGWRVGGVHPHHEALDRALVCELPSGTVLLPLGALGVRPLPDDVPTLWVTAPTRAFARAGLAVNAMFALDIGRSEVASRAPLNETLARDLGREFARALGALHGQAQDWPAFAQALALAADATPKAFWQSVWTLLAERELDSNFAGHLVRTLVWGDEHSGLWALVRGRDVLPTGLGGDHDVLTSLAQVTHQVSGVLARESVFGQFRESGTLSLQYPPGTLLHAEVAARLHDRTGGQVDLPELRLLAVLRAEFGDHPEITPERALQLAGEYSRDRLGTFGDEQAEVQDYLATFRFQSAAGTFIPAQELIVAIQGAPVSADEQLRAAFAPPERTLHPEYQAAAAFVVLCRGGLRADAKALFLWVTDARSPDAQRAALRYLLDGELASPLAEELLRGPATWLTALLAHPGFNELGNDDQHILAGRLGQSARLDQRARGAGGPPEEDAFLPLAENPTQVLEDLYEAWSETAEDAHRAYEEAIYPPFMRPGGTLLPFAEDRKRWMTLLLLGTYQSLGRTTPQQSRDFLQRAEDQGWLDVFAAPEVDAVEWFKILDGFLSGSPAQEYYHWFSRFLATYQLSRHLDEYMGILMGMERFEEPQSLGAVLNPSSSALFSGSGIDVPDLRRALGIGRHFVMRELLRTGTLVTPHMDAEAFHAPAAVRRELAALGCPVDPKTWNQGDSQTIHRFLVSHLGEKRATFHRAFDLPFVLRALVS